MGVPIAVDGVRAKLIQLGWTQERLAEEARLSKRTVEGILSRGTAAIESLHRIANAMKIDVDRIISTESTANPLPQEIESASSRLDRIISEEGEKAYAEVFAEMTVKSILENESVNLVVLRHSNWRHAVDRIISRMKSAGKQIGIVDLDDPLTATRQGLLGQVLARLGYPDELPDKPADLVEFGRRLRDMKPSYIIFSHFDLVVSPERQNEYGYDLLRTLRWFSRPGYNRLVSVYITRIPEEELLGRNYSPSLPLAQRTIHW